MNRFHAFGMCAVMGVVSCSKTNQLPVSVAESKVRPAERASLLLASFSAGEVQQLRDRMKETILVVQYDGEVLHVLPDCSVDGAYLLVQADRKTVTIDLDSAADVQLNAPPPKKATLPPQLKTSLLFTGRWMATRSSLERTDLHGSCGQATHFVRHADAGLPLGDPKAPTTCPTEALLRDHPCGTPLRVHLQPFGAPPPWEMVRAMPPLVCPENTFHLEEKCATQRPAGAFACRLGEMAECKAQCDAGNASSCNTYAWMLVRSSNVPSDTKRGIELFQQACAGGDEHACAHAIIVSLSEHIEVSVADALRLYETSCRRGDAESCLWLAEMLGENPEMQQTASAFYMRACLGGSAIACGRRAMIMEQDAEEVQFARAFHRRACEDQYIPSCVRLGVLLRHGYAGPANLEEGSKFLEMACEKGDFEGCALWAMTYHSGAPEEQDYAKAGELFEKACTGGSMFGCRMLGDMHEHALGRPRDPERAAGLYAKGCSKGEAESCSELGRMHLTGDGILKDERRASELFESACNGGFFVGCYNLGLSYEYGRGVVKDQKHADELYEKACKGGYGRACRMNEAVKPAGK